MAFVERMLFMGGPSTGKTLQLIKCVEALADTGKEIWVLDCEDKFEASIGSIPKHVHLDVAIEWEDIRAVIDKWKPKIKPGSWLMVDRVDLMWPSVQRWYTRGKYNEEIGDLMMDKAKEIKKSFMLASRFDQGGWQVVNSNFEYVMLNLLYGFRSNLVMTSGVKSNDQGDSPFELFGGVNVSPRGQKELGHQPHSAFLFTREKAGRGVFKWLITTAKDLKDRPVFDGDELIDFSVQYPYVK